MIRRALFFIPVLGVFFATFALEHPRSALAQSRLPNAKDVVAPAAYVSIAPVPRGRNFELAVVLKIRPGFHINAREKSADYLIATDLRIASPAGFKTRETIYPKGVLQKFNFTKTLLNVYEGTATIRVPLTALADAPLGPQRIPLKLRYQACSADACLPPVTLDLEAAFEVVPAGAASKPAFRELFPSH